MTRRFAIHIACTTLLGLFSSSEVAGQSVFVEDEGRVVIEAENFHTRLDSGSHRWWVIPGEMAGSPTRFPNYRGAGYVQALPNVNGASSPLQAPWVEYKIRINTAGVYRLWVRWTTVDDNSDTFYASVSELQDGPGRSVADWYRYVSIADTRNFASSPTWFGSAGFERTDSPLTNGESPATWTVPAPGVYTLRLSMREDGVAIDALVFQLSQLPAPTAIGPLESPQINLTDLSEPRSLTAAVAGSTVTLQWLPPARGQTNGYQVEAGTSAGRSDLAAVTLGPLTSFVAVGVPSGIYYVRVRARGATGVGPPSNEVTVAVGTANCSSPPNAPVSFGFTVAGRLVTLTWAPGGGCAVSNYVVQVGTQPGLADIAFANTGTGTGLSALAPAGAYYIRVLAQNAFGSSSASGEVVVVVP